MAKKRVLIVDDQKEVTRVLKSSLETLDAPLEIITVPSGEEAILEFARGEIDLLVSDYRLPGMSGLELMKKLKRHNLEMKVLLISGVADPKIRQQVAQAGADAFFFKPVEIADFLDAVERALGLVQTILQPEIATHAVEPLDEEEEAVGMTERIAQLQDEVKASAVVLLGDQGQILVRAGAFPDKEIEEVILPKILPLVEGGVRLTQMMNGEHPNHIMSFHGKEYTLFLAPVGEVYALMVTTDPQNADQLGKIASAAQSAAQDILANFSNLGISTRARDTGALIETITKESESQPVEDLSDPDLEIILEKEPPKKSDRQVETDDFWESAAAQAPTPDMPGGDSLTYEQAMKLGLAPSDD